MQGESFPGLLGLVYAYLETLDVEEKAFAKIEKYLDLIRRRANGAVSFTFLAQFFLMSACLIKERSKHLRLGSGTLCDHIQATNMIQL